MSSAAVSGLSRISVIKQTEARQLAGTTAIPLQAWGKASDDLVSVDNDSSSGFSKSESRLSAEEQRVVEQDARIETRVEQMRSAIVAEHEVRLEELRNEHKHEVDVCRRDFEKELDQVRAALEIAVSSTEAAIERVIVSAQPALLQLSTAIAETLTGATLRETEIDAVVAAVSWAIEELAHEQSVDIYLNPLTLNLLQDHCDVQSLSHGARIRWHGKPELDAEDWIASSSNTSIRRVRSEVLERMATVLTESIATPAKRPDETSPSQETIS